MTKLIPRYQAGRSIIIDKSSIPGTNPQTSSTINYNWKQRAANNESVKKAEQERAQQAYLNKRGYISEDKDKRSYAERDRDAKIVATQNAKTDFYQTGTPNAQSTDITPGQVLMPAFVAGTTFMNPAASLIYGGMYKPMEKAGIYQPVSLGLQKLGVNENTANLISPFITDPVVGLLPSGINHFANAYNKAWNQTYGNLNNLGISPLKRVTKKVSKLVKNPYLRNFDINSAVDVNGSAPSSIYRIAENIAERRSPSIHTKSVNQEAIDRGYEIYRRAVNDADLDNIQSIVDARVNFNKLKKRTTQELNDFNKLLAISPEYGIFLSRNPTLDGLSQEAMDAFIEHQSLSVRGIGVQKKIPKTTTGASYVKAHNASARDDKKAEKFLTTPAEYPSDRLGNRGLYTSNGRFIADKFMRPEERGYNSASYQGIVRYDFNIDRSKPLAEQLRQYRNKIRNYDWDVDNPSEEMIEATYVKNDAGAAKNIYERSINPKGTDQPVVDLRELQYFGDNLPNLHSRWGFNDPSAVSDLDLFIPKQPSSSFGEFLNFARRLKSLNEYTIITRNPNYNTEKSNATSILENQLKKRNELFRQLEKKHNFVTKTLPITLSLASGASAAAMGINSYNKAIENRLSKRRKQRIEEYKKYKESLKKQ